MLSRPRPTPVLLPAMALGLALATAACAHRSLAANPEFLKERVEAFNKQWRWNGPAAALPFIASERRADFLKALTAAGNADAFQMTDCDVVAVQVEGERATVINRLGWYRLPSVSLQSAQMIVEWRFREGTWGVVSIQGGPLTLEPLPAPKPG